MPSSFSLSIPTLQTLSQRLFPAAGEFRWHAIFSNCLPARLAKAVVARDRYMTLVLKNDKALLYQNEGLERHPLAELQEPHAAGLEPFLLGKREEALRSRIELPAEWIVSRALSLPSQARANLRQVIRYEMDRLTPFNPDQVYYDYRLLEGRGKGDRLHLELALCRREPIQPWLEWLKPAGIPIERITWPHAWPAANLLPEDLRPRRGGRLLSTGSLLSLLALILMSAALAGPIWQKTQILAELEGDLGRLKGQATEVTKLREAIEAAHKGSIAVLERKSSQAAMIDLLRDLTDRLPDGTWVENLEFQGNEVQIRGESTQSAALIGLLENAPAFSGVSFRSPVTQGRNNEGERFHIGFTFSRVPEGS